MDLTQQMYRQIFLHSPVGKALVDGAGRLLTVNRAFARLVGYSVEEIQAKSFQEITHPDDLQSDLELFEELKAGRRDEYFLEKRYITKDGRIVYIGLHASAIRNEDGAVELFIAQVVDRSEEKRLLERLQQNNAHLLNINRIMVHDLRGPLANQAMLLDLLQDGSGVMEASEILQLLRESTTSMLQQVNDLLYVARLSDATSQQLQACHLPSVLDTVVKRLAWSANMQPPEIVTDFQVHEILYPKALLESVMYNFLSNSIKYAKPGVRPHLDVQSYESGSETALAFKDNGIGMDLNSTTFQLFGLNQVGDSSGAKGMGVGLHTVKDQVERLGGRLSVSSVPGEGTTFILYVGQGRP